MPDLIEIPATDGLRIALVYATSGNLTGRPVYAPGARCALRPAAADCLFWAARAARRAGLCLVVYDAYRPAAAQAVFWRMLPDPRYVADAAQGSNHTRGVAVDVTLTDADGAPLDMGTDFDDMRDQSHHDRDDLPPAALVGMRPDGGMALGAVLASLARDPRQLPALIRTGRQADRAFAGLKAAMEAVSRIID